MTSQHRIRVIRTSEPISQVKTIRIPELPGAGVGGSGSGGGGVLVLVAVWSRWRRGPSGNAAGIMNCPISS